MGWFYKHWALAILFVTADIPNSLELGTYGQLLGVAIMESVKGYSGSG